MFKVFFDEKSLMFASGVPVGMLLEDIRKLYGFDGTLHGKNIDYVLLSNAITISGAEYKFVENVRSINKRKNNEESFNFQYSLLLRLIYFCTINLIFD
jgi:hypothetical protein